MARAGHRKAPVTFSFSVVGACIFSPILYRTWALRFLIVLLLIYYFM